MITYRKRKNNCYAYLTFIVHYKKILFFFKQIKTYWQKTKKLTVDTAVH